MKRSKVEIVAESHLEVRSRVTDKGENAVSGRAGCTRCVERSATVDRLKHRHELPLLNERISEPASK